MKKLKVFIFVIIAQFSYSLNAQIGINTTSPTATLDVNGDLRIRKVDSISSAPKYILTPDDNGVVQKVNVDKLSDSNPEVIKKKSMQYYLKIAPSFLQQEELITI
ncbi:hypothetical protein [Chryseobacterium paridis]|uniref:Uncharacterized protein n=1 Tax=Chryseobacterium paridis TaxID=2800328 RepID=A0ABS1FV83_9FLAO|nr:hypothetical protein [Chryseobacterium paridis]MBK1896336.1 hypothetical protein [Chryseobacterium paridis]